MTNTITIPAHEIRKGDLFPWGALNLFVKYTRDEGGAWVKFAVDTSEIPRNYYGDYRELEYSRNSMLKVLRPISGE